MRSGIASKGARSDSLVNASWILAFALGVFVTQIGGLERERASGDESTYIVMAAHVLDGNLPYVELFDTKPPMPFFLLAGAMAVFGESLLVARARGRRLPPGVVHRGSEKTPERVPRYKFFDNVNADVLRDLLARDYRLFHENTDGGSYRMAVYRRRDRPEP